MAKLDSYLARKAQALTERRADWTAAPDKSTVQVSAVSTLAGITGARPTRMGIHGVVSDSAPGMAGHSLGPTAPEMLLGALASCLVHTYVIQACILNVPLDALEVEVHGMIDMAAVIGMTEGTPLIQDLSYTARVEGPDAPSLEALHEAVEMSCPVLNTLRQPVVVRRQPAQ